MNPVHRQEESHPGDSDWEDESTTSAKKNKSECPYGDECYRENPDHIKTYHSNRQKTSSRKRTTRKRRSHLSFSSSYDVIYQRIDISFRIDRER